MLKHGLSKHPLYLAWCGMMSRCYNPENSGYCNYGARGVVVCDEWKSDVIEFILWGVSNGFKRGLQIDRIDVNGNYEKNNCRFITRKENCRNKRNNTHVEYEGKKRLLVELAEENNISNSIVHKRLKRGWTIEKALTEPLYDESKTFAGTARRNGVAESTLRNRIKRGWDLEKALTTKVRQKKKPKKKYKYDGEKYTIGELSLKTGIKRGKLKRLIKENGGKFSEEFLAA